MGVPRQILSEEAEADRELAAATSSSEGKPTVTLDESATSYGVVQPNQVEPKAEEPKETASTVPTKETEAGGLIDEELKSKERHREESAAGRLAVLKGQRKADLERWEMQEKAYKERIAALEAENGSLRERGQEASAMDGGNELGEDQIAKYREILGDDYSDEDIIKFHRASQLGASAELRALRRKIDERDEADRERAAANAVSDFMASLERDFPGFILLDRNRDRRLMEFYDTPVGGFVEGTFGDIAKAALRNADFGRFSKVVREFAARYGVEFSPNGVSDGRVAAMVRPESASFRERRESPRKTRVVPRSEITRFMRMWQAGKAESAYGIDSKAVRDCIAFYEQAEADGNVDETR